MSNDDNDEREEPKVGYGHPPLHSRWKPGASGNKRGRSKGARNHRTIISEQVNKTVFINENGKRVRKSRFEVMIAQQANKGTAGELKATQFVVEQMAKYGLLEVRNEPAGLAPIERAVLDDVLRRLRAYGAQSDANESNEVPITTDSKTKGETS